MLNNCDKVSDDCSRPLFGVIDFQGYKDVGHQFIVKEITFSDLTDEKVSHLTFRPPSHSGGHFVSTPPNFWTQRHHHGISWNDGEFDYSELETRVTRVSKAATFLFSKGHEKCVFLESVLHRPVYDLADFGCPPLKELGGFSGVDSVECCSLHSASFHTKNRLVCSYQQAIRLIQWMKFNYGAINLTTPSSRLMTFQLDSKIWKNIENPFEVANAGFTSVKTVKNCVQCIRCSCIIPIFAYADHICEKTHQF